MRLQCLQVGRRHRRERRNLRFAVLGEGKNETAGAERDEGLRVRRTDTHVVNVGPRKVGANDDDLNVAERLGYLLLDVIEFILVARDEDEVQPGVGEVPRVRLADALRVRRGV